MNDRDIEVLTQYELEVLSTRRGRGAWIVETGQGTKLLREYRGTVKRLNFENQVLGQLEQTTVERYVPNKEGELLSQAPDGTHFIVKDWYQERECSLKDVDEIRRTTAHIARLHRELRKIEWQEEWAMGSSLPESIAGEMERHNRELRRARTFIRDKKKKTEFEWCVIGNYETFYREAKEACEGIQKLEEKCETNEGQYLCHGDLNQHHILMKGQDAIFLEFGRMHLGLQMTDLYQFMRKVMEKHDWNLELGQSILDIYSKILPVNDYERRVLYYMFLYPEKYWKQINFYINMNKAWIPEKNVEKLHKLEEQEESRCYFLEHILTWK